MNKNEPIISVGILEEDSIKVEFYGDFIVENEPVLFSGIYVIVIKNNHLFLMGEGIEKELPEKIIFSPSISATEFFTLHNVTIGVKFHWERKEKQSFKGELLLLKNGNKIIAVNLINIEEYLTSVISSEMSSKCSLELLKAHAIISRSWLLAQVDKSKKIKINETDYSTEIRKDDELIKWWDREDHQFFDVCADDHCQRYQGITKIHTDIAKQAVQETYGLVLMYEDEICDARYSKSCGGISEAFENVWEPKKLEYLVPVIDYRYEHDIYSLNFNVESNAVKWIKNSPPAFCNTTDKKILSQILLDYDQETNDFFRWKVIYSQKEISSLIKKNSEIDFGDIVDLIPVERGYSSRLIKLKIVGTKKTMIVGKELYIRKLLSKTHLYSSAFYVEKEKIEDGIPQKFILYGAGWGHGVGFCQIGGAVMAEKGYLFDEIVLHYYKNALLKKIY